VLNYLRQVFAVTLRAKN